MQALLLVAHGSRRMASNEEVQGVAQQVAALAGARFAYVRSAFLELTTPSIPEGIADCVAQGATTIVVMPYFLAAGRHVVQDVPALVQESRLKYPQVAIRLSAYLGAAPRMPELILETVDSGHCLCGKPMGEADCEWPICMQAVTG